MGGVQYVEVEVKSPYDPSRRETVKMAIRPKTMEWFAKEGHLKAPQEPVDGTEARMVAYRRFAAIYARAETGAQAIDYSAQKVDTSPKYDGTPQFKADALSELAAIGRAIGHHRKGLIERIMSEQYEVSDLIIPYRRRHSDAYSAFYAEIRESLDGLIEYFGVAEGRKVNRIRVSRENVNNLDLVK